MRDPLARPKPLKDAFGKDRVPQLAPSSIPDVEMKDALRCHTYFLANDLYTFKEAMDVEKAWWNLSATVATRNPNAPYRSPGLWKDRLNGLKASLPVRA